ncbi:hypothetical protein ACFQ0D_37865, partial [Micromonospora zhanjiangensis]
MAVTVDRIGRTRRPAGRIPPWAVDIGLCLLAALATGYRIRTGTVDAGERPPDATAYGIGLAMSVALLPHRRWPAVTMAAVVVGWLAYHVLDYPGGEPAVPVWIALY